MRAFIYRITFPFILSFFCINALSAQGIISPNSPSCGFDEITNQLRQDDPQIEQEIRHFLDQAIPELSTQNRSLVEPMMTISVVVHVIHSGEPIGQGSNISDQQVVDQVNILSQDFQALNTRFYDTPTRWEDIVGVPNIQFLLATVDPNGNPTNGITRHNIPVTGTSWNNNNINSEIKPATNWDPNRYMNIYVVAIPGTTAAGGVVGYSNYPTLSLVGADKDGPVIDYHWFGGPGHPNSGWRPITHETGHYLGLPHTFNGTSCSSDDNIADTPNADDATTAYVDLDCTNSYPTGPTSCTEEHLYVNYMDYVDEVCYTSFTQGQVNVMRSVMDGTSSGFGYGSREDLVSHAPSQTVIPAFDAGITRLISPAQNNCTPDELTPVVALRNFGTENLTQATISYQVNNEPLIVFNWQGSLFPGESAEVTLPAFTPPDGQYLLTFFSTNPNGQPDERAANDQFEIEMFTYFAFDPPMMDLAEGTPVLPTPLGTYQFNFGGDDFTWEISNEGSSYGYGLGAFMFDNRAGTVNNNPSDTYDLLITRHFDFSEVNSAALYFDVSYATYNSIQVDTLYVLIATGCSQNFNTFVYKKWGTNLATAPPTQDPFIPMPAQWRTEGVDLSFFDGMDDVTIGFLNVSNWGNRLYIDNIRVGVDCGLMTAEWDITPNGCDNEPGECSGEALVNVPISNGMTAYEWEGYPISYNEPFITGQCEGPVEVTIIDEFGCQITVSNEIPQAAAPDFSVSSIQETGYQTNDGSATATINNGQPPFTFTWSNGETFTTNNFSHSINNLPAGSYTVSITDESGCLSEMSINVASVCTGFDATLSSENVSCFGGNDGSSTAMPINGTGPFSYTWSNGNSGPNNNSLIAGNYSATITDANGCPVVESITISEPQQLTLAVSSTNVSTINAMDGTASATPSGGTQPFSFLWNNGGTTATISNLSPDTYTVTVTDTNGCTNVGSAIVQSVSCGSFMSSIDGENISCFGENDGSAMATVEGETAPVDYAWSNGGTSAFINDLLAGIYSVTITDAAGCSDVQTVEIQQPSQLSVGLSSTPVSTPGGSDGAANAIPTGGTPFLDGSYLYSWSNAATTQNLTGLSIGVYSVTVTDSNGCTSTGEVVVSSNSNPCLLAISMDSENATCPNLADGSAAVTSVDNGTAPFTYLWSNGATTAQIGNLLPDNYTVTVSDINGCTANGWIPITGEDTTPPTLVLVSQYTISIENDPVNLDPFALDNGSFDNCSMVNLEASKTVFDCSDLGETDITITATDTNGNQTSGTVTIIVQDKTAPEITCPDDISMDGCADVIYATPTATDNCSVEQISLIDGFPSGQKFPIGQTTVVYEAIDNSGNSSTCSFEVFVDYDLSLGGSNLQNPSCAGSADGYIELVIQGGQPPYQYNWSHGGNPTDLPAGQYTVTITDANECSIIENFTLNAPSAIEVNSLEIVHAMGGIQTGSIQISLIGGMPPFVLQWFENGLSLPSFDPLASPPGTYMMEATDSNGCVFNAGPFVVDNLNSVLSNELERSILLYPNPTDGFVTLEINLKSSHDFEMAIFDVNGKNCFQTNFSALQFANRIDLNHLGQGVYWVKILAGNEMAWKKLIII